MIGKKYHYLTVLEYVGLDKKNHKSQWKCVCDCGNIVIVNQQNLLTGNSKRCRQCADGLLRYPRKDLTGQKFGRLTVVSYVGDRKYKCLCDCGRETIVVQSSLTTKNTQSCGNCDYGNNHSRPEIDMIEKTSNLYGCENVLDIEHIDKYKPDCILLYNKHLYDIEYDGAYWHNKEHDDIRDNFFINNGYRVLRFVVETHTLSKTFITEDLIKESVNYMDKNNIICYKKILQ